MKASLLAFLPLLLLPQVSSSDSDDPLHYDNECDGPSEFADSVHYGEYEATISRVEEKYCGVLTIKKSGKVVHHYRMLDAHFDFGAGDDKKERVYLPSHRAFKHLTLDPTPQLLVTNWSGGTHCCHTLYIFELGERFPAVTRIEGGSSYPWLEYVDNDGVPEIRVNDDILAYRFSSGASSAIGTVILKYSGNGYRVAAELMRNEPPSLRELEVKVEAPSEAFHSDALGDNPPPSLIQAMTDLFYSGNMRTAMDLVDRAWPSHIAGKAAFLDEYERALRESRYFQEFEKQL